MLTPDDLKAIGALLTQQKQDILAAVDEKLNKQKDEIIKDVSDYFADDVLPLLEKHDKQLDHLEQHISHPPGALSILNSNRSFLHLKNGRFSNSSSLTETTPFGAAC